MNEKDKYFYAFFYEKDIELFNNTFLCNETVLEVGFGIQKCILDAPNYLKVHTKDCFVYLELLTELNLNTGNLTYDINIRPTAPDEEDYLINHYYARNRGKKLSVNDMCTAINELDELGYVYEGVIV